MCSCSQHSCMSSLLPHSHILSLSRTQISSPSQGSDRSREEKLNQRGLRVQENTGQTTKHNTIICTCSKTTNLMQKLICTRLKYTTHGERSQHMFYWWNNFVSKPGGRIFLWVDCRRRMLMCLLGQKERNEVCWDDERGRGRVEGTDEWEHPLYADNLILNSSPVPEQSGVQV